jgi:chromosome segregation ATPase
MKSNLKARRQELLRELDRINRQILETQKSMAQIESKIGSLQDRAQGKAA